MSDIVLSNGLRMSVGLAAGPAVQRFEGDGITDTSNRNAERVARGVEAVSNALPAQRLGEIIAAVAKDLAAGVESEGAIGGKQEFTITFGLVVGGSAGISLASSKAEAQMTVSVKFEAGGTQ